MVRALITPGLRVSPLNLMGFAPVELTLRVALVASMAELNKMLTLPCFNRMKLSMLTTFAAVVAAVVIVVVKVRKKKKGDLDFDEDD